MPWETTTANTHYASGPLRWVGGGDADIFSKDGRTTNVRLEARNVRPDDAWRNILVDVFFSVKEGRKNHTHLTWTGTAMVPVPLDAAKRTSKVIDARDFFGSWVHHGKAHHPIEIGGLQNTIIRRGSFRIDGSGDDQNNAGVELEFVVPVRYFDEA